MVQECIFDGFIDLVTDRLKKLRVGECVDGAVNSSLSRSLMVQRLIDQSTREGAQVRMAKKHLFICLYVSRFRFCIIIANVKHTMKSQNCIFFLNFLNKFSIK